MVVIIEKLREIFSHTPHDGVCLYRSPKVGCDCDAFGVKEAARLLIDVVERCSNEGVGPSEQKRRIKQALKAIEEFVNAKP